MLPTTDEIPTPRPRPPCRAERVERPDSATPGADGATPDPGQDATTDDDTSGRRLLCAACRRWITAAADRIAIDGKSQHTFVNPHGLVFQLTTYRDAPGCVPTGALSTDWSWFPGHSWQIQRCGGCGAHLGWSFHAESARFWGLITDRLVEEDSEAE